ncbi:hypothetical protein CPB85DRAFT_1371886 [Mucidula mucida]|nr:hypothetical protein CPB85DRAFT_1371886 [Mucidula mucida]
MASGIELLDPNNASLAAPDASRWYLGYGSNLSVTGFLVKRNITPLHKKAVVVDSLILTFDNPGVPFIKPRFANCRLSDPPHELWTPDKAWSGEGNFLTILRSEGGGTSYQPLRVPAVVSPNGTRTPEAAPGYASLRYMNLLRNGAREQKMPDAYIAYLDSIPSYRPSSIRQRLGRIFHIVGWMPGLLLFFRIVARTTSKNGSAPSPVRSMRVGLFGTMWTVYDWVGRWIFGDGEASK